jgi:hypothetical protein
MCEKMTVDFGATGNLAAKVLWRQLQGAALMSEERVVNGVVSGS